MSEELKKADPNSAKTWEPLFLMLSNADKAKLAKGEFLEGVSEQVRLIALGSDRFSRQRWLSDNVWPTMEQLRIDAAIRHPDLFPEEVLVEESSQAQR